MRDLTGKSFRYFDVLGFDKRERNGKTTRTYWKCRCKRCGKECLCLSYQLIGKQDNKKSCGCLKRRKGEANPCWSGYGLLSQCKFREIRNGAKTRNIKFNLTKKQLWELFQKQGGKCALTSLPLDLSRDERNGIRENASLDRIDSMGDYDIKNVRWLHKDVNLMKNILSDARLRELCLLVVKNNC